jgi:hypothetical protein
MWRCNIVNKELIGIALIAMIFFGTWAVAAESGLYTFTLRADRVLTDYIGGNATSDKVNITGLIIQAGQVLGYYNETEVNSTLYNERSNREGNDTDIRSDVSSVNSSLTALSTHIDNNTNPHVVTAGQLGAVVDGCSNCLDGTEVNETGLSEVPTAGYASNGVPVGGIIMWSGTLASIPLGWQLCDGTGGTPNLIDKFVKGVATGSTDPGTTGGTVSKTTDSGSGYESAITGSPSIYELGTHTHGISDIRPPYYELAFICKT